MGKRDSMNTSTASPSSSPATSESPVQGRRRRKTSTVEDVALAVPRYLGRYYYATLFHDSSKMPRQDHTDDGVNDRIQTQSFCFVLLWFTVVTVAFVAFATYCGQKTPEILRELIPGIGNFFGTIGSYGFSNMLIAFIAILLFIPIPFRLFGSSWVSFSTSEKQIPISARTIGDIVEGIQSKKLNIHDVGRLMRLIREENVHMCRSILDSKIPKIAQKREKSVSKSRWWSFIALQLVLAGSALLASVMSQIVTLEEVVGRGVASATTGIFSVFCLCLAVIVTHGIGGRLKHNDFEFYQPFTGGALFCTLQGISWTLFSISVFAIGLQSFCSTVTYLQITCFACLEKTLRGYDEGWVFTSASSLGLLAEVMMVLSLFAFRTNTRHTEAAQTRRDAKMNSKADSSLVKLATTPYRRHTPLKAVIVVMAWTMLFIKPEMIFFACFYSSMTLLPVVFGLNQSVIVLLWVAASCGYAYTYVGNPSGTGRRNWPAFRSFIQKHVFDPLFEPYFGMRLIRDTPKPFPTDAGQKYIFGYHPHGIIPLAAGWCSLTKQWKSLFPGLEPSVLTSSILHNIPLARDVIQFSGGRDVSWSSFKSAIMSIGSVLLIPGGQQEMLGCKSTDAVVRINVKHKGFIRMGLTTGAALVPIYNFGGTKTFDNLPFPISWQKWCMSALRANILFLPYGNWLFVPRTGPLTIIVCEPIQKHAPNPTDKQVDLMHRRYYTSLFEAFERHKDAAGYSDGGMTFSDPDFERISESEFERQWKLACEEAAASSKAGDAKARRRRRKPKRVMNEFAMATGIVVLLFIASHLLTTLVSYS